MSEFQLTDLESELARAREEVEFRRCEFREIKLSFAKGFASLFLFLEYVNNINNFNLPDSYLAKGTSMLIGGTLLAYGLYSTFIKGYLKGIYIGEGEMQSPDERVESLEKKVDEEQVQNVQKQAGHYIGP